MVVAATPSSSSISKKAAPVKSSAGSTVVKVPKPRAKDKSKQVASAQTSSIANLQQQLTIPTNLPICIIDNGGWTVKYGIIIPPTVSANNSDENSMKDDDAYKNTSNNNHDESASMMYNATARPPHQLTILAGDEITTRMKNLGQLQWNYPLERGMICDGETQLRVWARVLEVLGVDATSNNMMLGGGGTFLASIAAARRGKSSSTANAASSCTDIVTSTNNCAFLLLEPPFVPATISEGVDSILFRELGMARVARMLGPSMAAVKYISYCQTTPTSTTTMTSNNDVNDDNENENNSSKREWMNDNTECCCVVDSGYSFTHIVPTHNGGEALVHAIRRLDIGGKVLTNLLKESVTYRQWNMMDEYHTVNDAKEKLCYISEQIDSDMKYARSTRKGLRWFDREYLLPDFVSTFTGSIRLPEPLQRKQEMAEMEKIQKELDRLNHEKEREELEEEANDLANMVEVEENDPDQDDGEQGERRSKKKRKSKKVKKNKKSTKQTNENEDIEMDGASDNDSDEETDQQRLKRLKAMREAERKRREEEAREHQALAMSVERFAIPEVLFTPNDIGLDAGGIAEAIVESIEACDAIYCAAMYNNVLLVGGNTNLPGFAHRVELELRKLAPTNYDVRVYIPDNPVSYAWEGAKLFASRPGFQEKFSVDRINWESMKSNLMNQQDIWDNIMYKL